MFCPNCGAEVDENARFCNNCGTEITGSADSTESTESTESSAESATGGAEDVQKVETYTDYSDNGGPAVNDPIRGYGTNRNIVLCIICTLITCGIYSLYWMYVLNEEINSLSGEENATNGGLVILFSIITCGIYSLYWYYKMGERTDTIKQKIGMSAGSSNILFLVLGIIGFGIVNYIIMQDVINKSVENMA